MYAHKYPKLQVPLSLDSPSIHVSFSSIIFMHVEKRGI
jgi:hypothetical protein